MDDLDITIIELLEKDARMPVAKLARSAGVTASTVRKRINRLVNDGVVKFGTTVETAAVGYPVIMHISIKLELDKIQPAAATLAAMPEVLAVYCTSGIHDIFIVAVLRSTADVLQFLRERLSVIPGIKNVETVQVLEVTKHLHASHSSLTALLGRKVEGEVCSSRQP